MADDEIRDKEAADDLDPAFDSIDATMKDVARKEVKVTPEALEQIVNEAVAKAISEYEQARGLTPERAGEPEGGAAAPNRAREVAPGQPANPAAVPLSPWRAKIERLKGDMGLDEIEFDEAPAEPVETKIHRELSAQMGVHDFEFEDAPGATAEPDAPTRTEADAIAGWATQADAIAGWVTPVQDAAPPATPDVDQMPAPAPAEEKIDDAVPEFDWVAEELARLEAEEIAAPPEVEPAPYQEPEPVALAIPEAVAPAIEELPDVDKPEGLSPPVNLSPPINKPEVRATRGGLASWFRSAFGDKPQEREPAAVAPVPVPVPEPIATVMPAAPPAPEPTPEPAPEPEVAPPPPIVARREEPPRPARDPAAVLKPMTPDEMAKTVFFTFDPFPPVPPRLPREPKEPPTD